MKIEEHNILAYTKKHFPKETKTIERSMINFYHSRLIENKSEQEIFHQKMIYDGVIDLFELLAVVLESELEGCISKVEIVEHLKNIHIKT